MPRKTSSSPKPGHGPSLAQETLYVGIDIGKRAHMAGFLSSTLLTRHQRFEHCPALAFENSREGFRSLIDRIKTFVPLTQVQVLLEVTGHYHRALMQYLQDLDIPVSIIHEKHAAGGVTQNRQTRCTGSSQHAVQPTRKRSSGERCAPSRPAAGSSDRSCCPAARSVPDRKSVRVIKRKNKED